MSDNEFIGFTFTPILMEHQGIIEDYLKKYPPVLSGYTFACLLGWSEVYRYQWVILGGNTLLINAYIEELGQYHLLQPIGPFFPDAQKELLENLSHWEYPVKLFGVSQQFTQDYPEFCSHFSDYEDRDFANYLYKASDLALLEGRHFEKKRNLISQVDKVYHWTISPLDACCPECPKILGELGIKKDTDKSLQAELSVLNSILNNYERLHLTGYMIGIEGKPVAFSVVNTLNPTTKVVLFEKADIHFKGLFQLINRETSKAIMEEGYEFINREEDLGIEGLRKAKMSYYPIELIPSHTLTFQK